MGHANVAVTPDYNDHHEYSSSTYEVLKRKAKDLAKQNKYNRKKQTFIFYMKYKSKWKDWREEFMTTVEKNGEFTYKTIAAFARAKFPGSGHNQTHMFNVIGARPSTLCPWEGNWALERFLETWRRNERVQALCKKLEVETDAALVAYGTADLWLDYIGRIQSFQSQVDEWFQGRVVLDGIPAAKMRNRIDLYNRLTTKYMNMLAFATEKLFEACGGNRGNFTMQAMQRIIQKSAPLQQEGNSEDGVRKQMESLLYTAVHRSKLFNQPLPEVDERETKTIEV